MKLGRATRSKIRQALNLSSLTMCYAKLKLWHDKILRKVDETNNLQNELQNEEMRYDDIYRFSTIFQERKK